ncbi:CocE/NonD family hydrolase [Paucibacter sp. DJ1R-11]|uniref:CocE/NonD family hydrolase n=1 Tax=Paucibacter sp. DJ1R-11 TaxID=2893556 RepID=UPI0021E3C8C9|nr:CocE/NonD family hydrolase [Paucibacter sp. DJ1R-11]MCV2366098.1 CocE/NonD family hydrolase [Paucibacter sp. DJ1R-11]
MLSCVVYLDGRGEPLNAKVARRHAIQGRIKPLSRNSHGRRQAATFALIGTSVRPLASPFLDKITEPCSERVAVKRWLAIFAFVFAFLLCMAGTAQAQPELGSVYDVQDKLLLKTRDGATVSGILVRRKDATAPLPTVLQFTIYVRPERDLASLKEIADRGYVAMIAYSRGKYLSPDAIAPYEHDGSDAYDAIDWISRQPWSNGAVGMFGGSYNGFTQWAAAKKLHPALKTIVPYVANRPGMGLPMENNIFINPNYQWVFYVSNNKTLDEEVNQDRDRFRNLQFAWWNSGAAYRSIDKLDGTPNPLLQRWLQHPSYDSYWQAMAPYGEEFKQIRIPVLSVDGYYNDSQVSGLDYLREHVRHVPKAEHYLIIGPYGHFGAQRGGEKVINSLDLPAAALIDTKAITYQWLDHVLKGGPKPSVLKDKINYQVMGTDRWGSAPSLEAMSQQTLKLFLRGSRLDAARPGKEAFLTQEVDLKDREQWNNSYYPGSIVTDDIDRSSRYVFVSEPFEDEVLFNGAFSGEICARINKRDFDLGVTLYELTPEGKYFHLSYVIKRASYAKDPARRNVLTPGKIECIPLGSTKLVSKLMVKGSRLVAYLNVNKNPFSQLNYGTGKDVSEETIADATQALKVEWSNRSFITVPILRTGP